MKARRSAGLSTASPCLWAPTPPLALKGAPAHALDANCGFVSFGAPARPWLEAWKLVLYIELHNSHTFVIKTCVYWKVSTISLMNLCFLAVIFPRHVESEKLDRIVWNLSTFYAYISYHIKCSKAFMHPQMRRRVNTLSQQLDKTKLEIEKQKKIAQGRSFRRPV